MNRFLIIIFFAIITSCGYNTTEPLEKENLRLRQKLDSIEKINDSLKNVRAYLFDKALKNEQNDIKNALNLYRSIIESNEPAFWTILAEDRFHALTEKEKEPLKGIFQLSDTLILKHRNDNCGEWGGDEEEIKIYFKRDKKLFQEGKLTAFYIMNKYNCDTLMRNPNGAKPKIYKSKHKELNYNFAKIAEECIIDLLKHKLTNDHMISHAGVTNTVELKGSVAFISDPSLFIYDYPSFGWEKFHLLKKELMK